MAQAGRKITFTLPPELAAKLEEMRVEKGTTLNELVQEAVARYVEERQWQDVLSYGERQAERQGVTTEDVERVVDDYRSEAP